MDEGRLDLKHEYAYLFFDEERRIIAHRLAQAGYQPPRR